MGVLPREVLEALEGRSAFIPAVRDALANPEWGAAPERVLIVRLSSGRDIQQSTSHLLLFSELRGCLSAAFVDFAFFPTRRDRSLLSARNLPWFSGLVSGRSPADFDLVLISNAFALELVNLPYLFSTAGLGTSSAARSSRPSPLFVLGGSNAASAGALLLGSGGPDSDCLVDAIFFGEGEGAIGEIAARLAQRGKPARERLAAASAIPGLWVAGSGKAARRRVVRPAPPPLLAYPVLNSEEAATARLQISAGCPGFCSFCLEGWDRRPYRERSRQEILAAARELKARSGAETLELYSFNFNTHADLYELLFELNTIFRRVNLMSQRLDILAREPSMLALELAADKRSFTIGIEGISARMRRYYRKGIAESDLTFVLERLVAPGIRELKLFCILSGQEEAEDLAEFSNFAAELRRRRELQAPGLRILVSAGYLVRLPFTPLQYAPLQLGRQGLQRIAADLSAACEANGIEFRLAADFDDYLADQLLALGGSAIAPWLAALPSRGFLFDESLSRGAASSLAALAEGAGPLRDSFAAEKGPEWRPPLAFIEPEAHHALLYEHYRAARDCRDRALCLGGPCSDCGACEDPEDRRFLLEHRASPAPAAEWQQRTRRLLSAKANFPAILVRLSLPPSLRAATPAFLTSWLLRSLFAKATGAERAVFGAEELLFSRGRLADLLPHFFGSCVFSLSGPDAGAMRDIACKAGFEPMEKLPEPSRIEVEARIPPPFAIEAYRALRSWLDEERVAVVERRAGDRRSLTPSPRDLKRRIVYRIAVDAGEGGSAEDGAFSCSLELGAKARLVDWLAKLGPGAVAASSLRVVGFGGDDAARS